MVDKDALSGALNSVDAGSQQGWKAPRRPHQHTAVKPILQVPDPMLREVCAPVVLFGPQVAALAHDLQQTRQRYSALGLAAPQIGELLRVIALNPGQTTGHRIMVNPQIIGHGQNMSWGNEGCMSIDNGRHSTLFRVRRFDTITVRFNTVEGKEVETKARGLAARIIQHEIDHLDGKMIDRFERVAATAA